MPERVTLAELLAFVELTIQRFSEVRTRGLRCDLDNPRHRYSVLLLYAVLDYARSVTALANAGAFAGIPVIARSALDAYVDICNLCDHADYWRTLEAVDAAKWKALLERASAGGYPALEGLRKDALFPVARRKYAKELKQLRAEGIKTLEIYERFDKAGLKNEHGSIYAILSDATHNNLSGLRSRYMDYDDTEAWLVESGEVSRHSHHYELPSTLTTGEIVLNSIEKVLRQFGHGVAALGPAFRKLDRLWERLRTEERTAESGGQAVAAG
jgi:hypothetical protein